MSHVHFKNKSIVKKIRRIVKKMTLCCSKILSILLRGINSKSIGDFYHSNCLHSLRTKNQLESFKKAWENKIFCDVAMSSKDTKTLINT